MLIPEHPLPNDPEALTNLRVVIWGVGSYGGGLGSALFCQQYGAEVSLLDLVGPEALPEAQAAAKQHAWPWYNGDAQHACLHSADLIIISPAVKPQSLPTDPAILLKCVSDLMLFCQWHQGIRIGITGTKGKSSCSHICGQLCQWPVIGNSNTSVLAFLAGNNIHSNVVIELSSFQLWYLYNSKARFHYGIITMVDRDHLDWHSSLDEYQRCKQWLPDHSDNAIRSGHTQTAVKDSWFYFQSQPIAPTELFPLSGQHQINNVLAALEAAHLAGISNEEIVKRLATLTGLDHRQQQVHQCQGLCFINDSAATTPIAVMAALQRFTAPAVFILGGHDKGGDFTAVAAYLLQHRIPCVLLGDAAAVLSAAGIHGPICESLAAAVETAVQALGPSNAGHIVLSPGCASFGLFRNYIDRGEQFAAFARKRWPERSGA